jgi:hypothetical protein
MATSFDTGRGERKQYTYTVLSCLRDRSEFSVVEGGLNNIAEF